MSRIPWQRGLSRIKRWFEIVDFGDPEKNRIAFYVQVTALLLMLACALIALNYLVTGDALMVGILGIALTIFTTIFTLIRRRFLDLAAALLLVSMLVTLTIGVLTKNGMRGAGTLLYPVIIIFASLILNRRLFFIYTLSTLASIAFVIFAESKGNILITTLDPPNITLFITFTIIITFTALVVRVLTEGQQRNLQRAISKENTLQEQSRLLEASETRWRTLVANAPVIIAQCDRQGNVFFMNYKGIDPEILAKGMTVYTFVSEKFHETVRIALETMFATGQAAQYEIEILAPSGEFSWYAITAGPVIENGEVTSAVIIGTDISKLKQAEAEIRALNDELDQRVRDRTEALESAYDELELFSYTVSHNLRTPARAMTGFSEMLMRENKDSLDQDGQERLRRISQNAVTMGLMIDDLLDFLQLGKVPIRKREVSPTGIARLALGKLPTYLDNQHIQVILSDMPLCQADPALLTQVYTHLLDNAIKFSRRNPDAEIQVGSFEREGEMVYFVRDNGIGFDMQYVGKLFGMFAQLNRPGEFDGNGVGLATVQRIIRRHGGRVWAEGEPGKGATFYFTLPD